MLVRRLELTTSPSSLSPTHVPPFTQGVHVLVTGSSESSDAIIQGLCDLSTPFLLLYLSPPPPFSIYRLIICLTGAAAMKKTWGRERGCQTWGASGPGCPAASAPLPARTRRSHHADGADDDPGEDGVPRRR